jgi:hypothetical protein
MVLCDGSMGGTSAETKANFLSASRLADRKMREGSHFKSFMGVYSSTVMNSAEMDDEENR